MFETLELSGFWFSLSHKSTFLQYLYGLLD